MIIISFLLEIILNPFENSLIIRNLSNNILTSLFSVIIFCVWSCTQENKPTQPEISQAIKMQLLKVTTAV